jgi:hypothetical protein
MPNEAHQSTGNDEFLVVNRETESGRNFGKHHDTLFLRAGAQIIAEGSRSTFEGSCCSKEEMAGFLIRSRCRPRKREVMGYEID